MCYQPFADQTSLICAYILSHNCLHCSVHVIQFFFFILVNNLDQKSDTYSFWE